MSPPSSLRLLAPVFVALALLAAPAMAAIHIDGQVQPGEWRGARHITDFRQTEPYTGTPSTLPVEAWVLATPDGLAVAFRVAQPPAVPRTTQQVQRDFHEPVDRINFSVDFSGDGRVGYNFSVASTGAIFDAILTHENHFNADWDGIWQHAVRQDPQGWTVELRIPWYTAPMAAGDGGKRTIAIYLDRVIVATGERVAWPVASSYNPRFLSDFTSIAVPAYSQSLLAVTPYVAGIYDNVHGDSTFRQGADVFWKPNGQFQLTATVNPDFGQVESDDLVVNFGATETYFSDKRAFFTENHGIFDFSLLDDNSALIYTRRVGGPADDGDGASDIRGALKANGVIGDTSYGLLAADERGAAGRFFGAARVSHDFGAQNLGALLTRVNRPWLDRQATVLGIDHHWQPNERLTLWTNVVASDIRQRGDATRGAGATFMADYVMGGGWRQQWIAMHFDDQLQVNDFGYLSRNNFDYLHWEVQKRVTDLPADSRYSSHDWQFRIDGLDNDDQHLRLRRQLRIGRDSRLEGGGNESIGIDVNSAAWDDRLTRGHGALFLPPSLDIDYRRRSPRHGVLAYNWNVSASSGGLSGNREFGWSAGFEPTWFVSDRFNFTTGVHAEHTPDWLVWQTANLVGRFDERSLRLNAGFNWAIGTRQELRLKLQAIGLRARLRGAYRVSDSGRAVATSDAIDDFSVRTFGVQLRYRYQLAPLSYLYVVYGRGGYRQAPWLRGTGDLLGRALGLRDDEQLLIKLSYRFQL